MLLVLLYFLLTIIINTANAFTNVFAIHIPPHNNQCFFEDLVMGQEVTVSYMVSVGEPDLDFWVSDPNQAIIHIENKHSHGDYTIKPQLAGKFTFCFSNQNSSQSLKTIQFRITGADVKPLDSNVMMDPVTSTLQKLSRELHDIKSEQEFVVTRERWHRNSIELINGRVLFWGLFQTALLVVVCMFQVYYIKHFFEVKRII